MKSNIVLLSFVYESEYFLDSNGIPDDLIRKAKGLCLYQDESSTQVQPIANCSKEEVNQNSKRLIRRTNSVTGMNSIFV